MKSWDEHVAPHGDLEALAPGLWQVTGSLDRSPLPRNMQIWRAPNGALLIHSAICLDEDAMAQVDALGDVSWIIVPCALHRADALPYRQRYPKAQILCPAAARAKVEAVVPVDALCEEVLPGLGVIVHQPRGLKPFELHYQLPLEDGSQALVMTDALFNLGDKPPTGLGGTLLRAMGSVGPLGMSRIGRLLLLKNADQWSGYLNGLAQIENLRVLCVGHGEAITTDLAPTLERARSPRRKPSRWLRLGVAALILSLLTGGFAYRWLTADPARAMRTLQSLSVDLPLGRPAMLATRSGALATWTLGDPGAPVVVLIHGFGDAGAGWVNVAQALADRYRVILLDLPGHGRSTHTAPALTMGDLIQSISDLTARIDGPLILVGNSLGGWVAAEWALRHPARVTQLHMVNSAGFDWPLDPELLLPSSREGVRRKNAIIMGAHAPQLPGFMLDGLVALHQEPWLRPLFDHLMNQAPKLDERLQTFSGQLSVIWGTPDAFFPVNGYLDRVRATRPEVEPVLLEGCGHAPQYSCPDQLAAALTRSIP